MNKIPTLFVRDPETNLRYLTREVHPNCQWVIDGEGTATRKYDGTCFMFDGTQWWARREVKAGKAAPAGFIATETDDNTGKTVGWEPAKQSAFTKYHAEALAQPHGVVDQRDGALRTGSPGPGTYELVGPRINGNPEGVEDGHLLVRHGYEAAVDGLELSSLPLHYDGLREWLLAHAAWEGIVWHHPDGRMAKIKRRDFPS